MRRIPEQELDRIKAAADLVGLVRAKGVELKKRGDNYVGRCPFHDDKSPSLVVTPKRNLWHCMGACQVGGSAIDWVMKVQNVSFVHAVEILRDRQVVELLRSNHVKGKTTRRHILASPIDENGTDQEIMRQVVEFYHEALTSTQEGLTFLDSRGINSAEAIAKFKLGLANRTLGLRLPAAHQAHGVKIRTKLFDLGLYRGTGHEHFAGSLVIPIIASNGAITEMYGRKITKGLRAGTQLHSYLPGPHKGVWNPECLKSKEVILCEALIDALSFWVNGFKNVTSSYGTNGFTDDHLKGFIEHGVKKVFIAYDRDEAGDRAAEKLAVILNGEGIEAWRVLFPKGMDANEFACKVRPAAQALKVCLESAELLGKTFGGGVRPALSLAAVPDSSSLAAAATDALKKMIAEGDVKTETTVKPKPVPVETAPREPAFKAAPVDVPAEWRGEDLHLMLGEREYRVRGLQKNLTSDSLRVNLRVGFETRFHVDQLDLYNAKGRAAFIFAAASELSLDADVIKRDLGRVLLKCEQIQNDVFEKRKAGGSGRDVIVELSDEEKAEAMALLKDPDLLVRVVQDFNRCGVVGEKTNKLVGYLASVSRKLDQPLAVIIQSSSAAGKSSLMEAVLAMMPPEDQIKYSAMTGQSLFYIGETSLKHKILAIAEEEGASRAAYAMKLLQSEGEISIASTGKDPTSGRIVTQEYRVEGPVMIFFTTTAIDIDEELLNRCLVLTVDEDRDQTRAIHDQQRARLTIDGKLSRTGRADILRLHQNAQRLLRPLNVVNPYATKLTFLDTRTRMRRDHMKYLTLINAIALIHQHQRMVKKWEHAGKVYEYIEVEPSDIAIANELCHQVLGRSLDELAPQTRRLLVAIKSMVEKVCSERNMTKTDCRFTRKALRSFCGWSPFQVQKHIDRLVELEYLIAYRGRKGESFSYELVWDGSEEDAKPRLAGLVDARIFDARYLTGKGYVPPKVLTYDEGLEPPCSPEIAPVLQGCSEPESGSGGGSSLYIASSSENGTPGAQG